MVSAEEENEFLTLWSGVLEKLVLPQSNHPPFMEAVFTKETATGPQTLHNTRINANVPQNLMLWFAKHYPQLISVGF
jgi:hypothetical protein